MKRRYYYFLLPLLGTVFGLWYIWSASCDVIYSDYIRLVNSYLPDVWNPAKFLVPDVLTRIPANYLERIISVELLGFNTMLDRVLGVAGLGLSAFVMALYCRKKEMNAVWFTLLMVIMFSLNKWEMLVNGSGWAHFIAFAGFYYHYLVMDRFFSGEEKKGDKVRLIALPFVITIFFAGPYCAIYAVTSILAYGFMAVVTYRREKRTDKWYGIYGLSSLASLMLYMWSNSYAVEEHAASAEVGFFTQLADTPGFFIRFFIKSFGSMVIGIEQATASFRTNLPLLTLGLLVIAAYLLALILNFRYRIYEKTLLPLILIAAGGLNHVLIFFSRWIFLNEDYGASSRYALQFQIGILGIVMTFYFAWKLAERERAQALTPVKTGLIKFLAVCFCLLFLCGNCYTTYQEVKKAPYRKAAMEQMEEMALDFENRTDDELREKFEFRRNRPESGAMVRSALQILKENGWNVFRN